MLYRGNQLKRHSLKVDSWIAALAGIVIGVVLALNI